MARHGIRAGTFVYILYSAMMTPTNLQAIGDNLFITRLTFTYSETERVLAEGVKEGKWADVETMAPKDGKRKAVKMRYMLEGEVVQRMDAVERARTAAGCFVLLTNVPDSGGMVHSGAEGAFGW